MRLTEEQKAAALQARAVMPGVTQPELVRITDRWACVWVEPEQPPRERWRGLLLSRVVPNPAGELTGDPLHTAWWSGSESFGKTRRSVIEALHVEASI